MQEQGQEEDDFALLERWCAGDRRAGEALFKRYFVEIHRFFQNKIEGKTDDLVQQTFMACWKGRSQFRNASSFRTYLFAIARNELYMELRKQRREHVDLEASSLDECVSSPSNLLGRQEELARLRAALRQLSTEQQVLLELHYWHDFSASELAELFSATSGSIRVRLVRARQALHACLTARLDAGAAPFTDGFAGPLHAAERCVPHAE